MAAEASSLDPHTVADLLERFRSAGGDPSRLIMVGGTAGLQWGLSVPDGHGGEDLTTSPLRTTDVDFQVDRLNRRPKPQAEIERFAEAVGGHVIWPSMDDATPEIARVEIPGHFGPDDDLLVDFLPHVVGLKARDVAKHAELLEAAASDGNSVDLRVAHPVHVLLGLVENYLRLPARRNEETLARIDRMIPVVRQYIRAAAEAGADREAGPEARRAEHDARWSMQELLKQSATARYAEFTRDTGRDLTDAIPERQDAPVKPRFWEREYPSLGAKIQRRREAAMKRKPE
ncbi:MAG: hypothetical protein U5K43_11880 [Halofilum sp. (in: g-proteobacteria)]|nr:hypothetical protein [Halofilum sp. (in: g-proteobacteria)]